MKTVHSILAILAIATVGAATLTGSALAADNKGPAEIKGVYVVNAPDVRVINTREPVHFRYQLSGGTLSNVLHDGLFQVPDGMRLTVTFVSGVAGSPEGTYIPAISLHAGASSTSYRALHYLAIPAAVLNSFDINVASLSQPMNFVVHGGERVGMQFGRSSAPEGSPQANVVLSISGYLEEAH